jgi:transcriptional regulator with XRE-family HTH domain
MHLFPSAGCDSILFMVSPINSKSLTDLLRERELTGRQLARMADTTESSVSQIRRGLVPGKELRKRIYKALKATDEEIAALGWEKETAGV